MQLFIGMRGEPYKSELAQEIRVFPSLKQWNMSRSGQSTWIPPPMICSIIDAEDQRFELLLEVGMI